MDPENQASPAKAAAMAQTPNDPLIGTVLEGRYRLLDVLGLGGVGVVYRAEHLKLKRQVAVKLLQSEYAENDLLRKRFEREATALAALSHPHIITVTDYGISEHGPFLAMELVEGKTLGELLKTKGALRPGRAMAIAKQMLEAVAFAHSQKLIHRDLKPSNIFLQGLPDGQYHVRVLDFGLAKFLAGEGESGAVLTKTGAVIGTPGYMAPEQGVGGEVDARTDVYALGILIYEMMTGQRPFIGEPSDLLRQHLLDPVPAFRESMPEIRPMPEVEALVQKAMSKQPEERFADAGEMLQALLALPVFQQKDDDKERSKGPLVAVSVLAIVALAAAAYFALQ